MKSKISSKCSHKVYTYHKSSLQKIYYLPLLSVCRNPSLNTSHLWNSWGFRLLLALIHCQKEQKKRTYYPGINLEIYKSTKNIYLMLRVFLAFVVLGNKLQHLEPNKNPLCTFLSSHYYCPWLLRQNHLHLWSETLFSDRKTRCLLSELIGYARILTHQACRLRGCPRIFRPSYGPDTK